MVQLGILPAVDCCHSDSGLAMLDKRVEVRYLSLCSTVDWIVWVERDAIDAVVLEDVLEAGYSRMEEWGVEWGNLRSIEKCSNR